MLRKARGAVTLNRVDDHVLIGGYLAAACPWAVRGAGVTRIVKMFDDDETYFGGATRLSGIEYAVFPAEDHPDFDIRPAASAAFSAVLAAVAANEQVLVHCHAGVSRSATVVALYLMRKHGWSSGAAIGHLQSIRPIVRPNPGFVAALRELDG